MQTWKTILEPYVDKDTWLDAPRYVFLLILKRIMQWLTVILCFFCRCITEFYMYRRIMEAMGYFDPNSNHFGLDPFQKTKAKVSYFNP